VAAGCGGNAQQSVEAEVIRADGSLVTFPQDVRAWCGPYDDENRDVEGVHVLAGELPRDETPAAFWMIRAVRADVERDPVTILPNDFVYTDPEGADVFGLDAERRNNELSSATEESKGTIRVELDGCDPGDTVRVTFEDVVLGSEYHDLPTVSVAGSVVAEIER
jgi:hypothetical protein